MLISFPVTNDSFVLCCCSFATFLLRFLPLLPSCGHFLKFRNLLLLKRFSFSVVSRVRHPLGKGFSSRSIK